MRSVPESAGVNRPTPARGARPLASGGERQARPAPVSGRAPRPIGFDAYRSSEAARKTPLATFFDESQDVKAPWEVLKCEPVHDTVNLWITECQPDRSREAGRAVPGGQLGRWKEGRRARPAQATGRSPGWPPAHSGKWSGRRARSSSRRRQQRGAASCRTRGRHEFGVSSEGGVVEESREFWDHFVWMRRRNYVE